MNYWVMIPIVCIFGFAQGALVERVGVRPAIKTRSEFGWIMATIALGIIFKNVAENVWGRDDLRFPSRRARSRCWAPTCCPWSCWWCSARWP